MKRHHRLFAATLACASLALPATTAFADCAAELAALPGIAKDGSAAPLAPAATPQTGGGAERAPDAAAKGAGKDGSQMPLGADPNVAMSAEDAQAQSQGGETAAAQAAGAAGGEATSEAAVAEARAALASGDEEACMAALAKAKGM